MGQAISLILDWADSSEATSYDYCIDAFADGSCVGSWYTTGAASQVGPLSLSISLTYEWQVRANNGVGGITYANSGVTWTFSTTNFPINYRNYLPLLSRPDPFPGGTIIEGFEGGVVPPTSWTTINNNPRQNWRLGPYGFPHTGSFYADVEYDSELEDQDEILLSPYFTTNGGSISLYSSGSSYWCRDTHDNCDLQVWLVRDAWDAGSGNDVFLGLAENDWLSNFTYYLSTFDFTAYVAGGQTVRIALRYIGNDGAEVTLDDITINY